MEDARQKKICETINELLQTATTGRSPFTIMHLATVDPGGAPKARVVVLREASDGVLSFITDLRSPKVRDICAQPLVTLSWYDANTSVQLRIEGRAGINTDEERRKKFWKGLRPHTHLLFRSPMAPGATVFAPEDRYAEAELHNSDSAKLYAHFGLVDVIADCFDWLDLSSEPHVRCQFTRAHSGWKASWVAP